MYRPIFPYFLALGFCNAELMAEVRYAGDPSVTTTGSVNDTSHDLSQHFCRIYRHASVVADGKIYIDGGNAYIATTTTNETSTTPSTDSWSLGMNDQLLVLDLSSNFTATDTTPYRSIQKHPDVPNGLIESSLLYSKSSRKVTQIGGWFSYNSQTDPGYVSDTDVPAPSIWEFDIDSEIWDQATGRGYPGYAQKVERPGAAAYCDASTLNKSFVFEGHVWRRSDPAYSEYVLGEDMKFLEGMLMLDTSSAVTAQTLTNISVPVALGGEITPFGPRMNGAMVHVPIGDEGVLVFIGGQTTQNPTDYGVQITDAAQANVMLDTTFVDLYDLESGFWFRQQTFGAPDIPSARSDICVDLIVAGDQSSYNVLMVAGMSNYRTYLATEEIWALSLPTFQWILVHTRPGGRYGHTCHIVGENLLLIGGMETQSDGQDVQTCSDTMPAEIFNLALQDYTTVYDASGASRDAPVPSQVVSVIGGTSTGGAQATTPKVWSDIYLQYIFNPSLKRPAYTPTYNLANETHNSTGSDTGGDGGLSTGAIVGAAVGGALGAILLISAAVVALLYRNRMKRRSRKSQGNDQGERLQKGATSAEHESGKLFADPDGARELDSNLRTPELHSPNQPVELFAPQSWSEISASPVGPAGRLEVFLKDGSGPTGSVRSRPSLAFSQHRSLSVRTT